MTVYFVSNCLTTCASPIFTYGFGPNLAKTSTFAS